MKATTYLTHLSVFIYAHINKIPKEPTFTIF